MAAIDRSDKMRILETLAELSGHALTEDQIKRQGTELVLPANMSPEKAIKTLEEYKKNQDAIAPMVHRTKYRYLDGVVATKRVLRRMTGMTPTQMEVVTFFGSYTPPTINVQIDLNEWEECPTGEFPVEIFEGTVQTDAWHHEEYGMLFQVVVNAPRKYANAVTGFFKLLDEELATNSIYRGKAVTAESTPTFLDLSGVDPSKVVYSDEVMLQLDANIWSLIQHTDAMRTHGLPLKRAVLLEGPYGTGKTLAAFLTAQQAVENGWTFIFVRPGKDNLAEAMATAQLYQPSVVFFEDIDITNDGETDVSQLLDIFDGVQAKGTEIVAILTTNHAEKIHKGLVRPGRLDAVIHIGALDQPGIERLIRATIDQKWLPAELDMDAIAEAMDGFAPAFVKEAIDRAFRYGIARNEGVPSALTSQDFVDAGNGLRPQLELMEGAPEEFERNTFNKAFEQLLGGFAVRGSGGNLMPLIRLEEAAKA